MTDEPINPNATEAEVRLAFAGLLLISLGLTMPGPLGRRWGLSSRIQGSLPRNRRVDLWQ